MKPTCTFLIAFFLLVPLVRAQDSVAERFVTSGVQQEKAQPAMPWKRIPWSASLLDARRLSAQEHVPVFLFALKGDLGTGRC